jgi:hypothetical protein
MESASIRGGSPLVPAFAASIALLFAACGGGGGGGGPAATFSFAAAGASASEGGANLDVQVVLHTTQSALAAPASVDVVDLGTGTATSGTDYAAFAPQTLTFPIGAMDGDVQSVAVSALDDAEIEGAPETVRLGLANPAGGALAGASAFAVGIDDADQATIEFASASSTAPDESATPRNVSIVLELPAGTSLAVAASVRLSDDGAGSATSGADYDAIPQQTIAFAAGSLDGATQTIAVNVNDDATPELDETVELALASPTAGTVVGGTDLHTLTITDDENLLPPAFVASEGATGVENPLAYDELVDLGSQGVGDGPNAGTLVRVTNVGGSAMDLGAPRLTGTNANDFVVEIESAPLPPPAPETDVAAPIVRLPTAAGPGIAFRFEPAGLRELRALPRAKVHGFPVPGLGDLTLELARLPLPIAAGAVLRVDGVDVPGGLAAAVGDLSVWSGSIVEVPGSHVFLALSSAARAASSRCRSPGTASCTS